MAQAERNPAPHTSADLALIKRIIPHRYPFLMIDKVRDIVPYQGAVGIKCVTSNEPHFPGHFPAQPIMPGVLIVEALAQAAGRGRGAKGQLAGRHLVQHHADGENVAPQVAAHAHHLLGRDPGGRADGEPRLGAGRKLARGLEVAAGEGGLRGGEVGLGDVAQGEL